MKLLIGGPFDNYKTQKYVLEITKTNQNIKYLGFLERKDIKEIFSISMAGLVILLPVENYFYSQPVKLFEYMLAGLPVVASNFPLWKEIIEKNNCGICVDPLNIEEIAKAIQFLINNPYEAKKMGENGRKLVIEKYNWQSESQKLIELYKQLLKEY